MVKRPVIELAAFYAFTALALGIVVVLVLNWFPK